MKRKPLLLATAAAILVTGSTTALAGIDPISVSLEAFVFGQLVGAGLAVSTSLVLAPVLLTAASVAALYGVGQLLKPKIPGASAAGSAQTVDPSAARNTFEGSDGPELRAVGRVRLGGLKVFGNSTGNRRHRLILHCKGEIDGFETIYLAKREVIIAESGAVTSFPWEEGASSACFLEISTGSDAQLAWPSMVTDFPGIWTTAHRARGIAQTHALFIAPSFTSNRFTQLYQGGVPDVEVVVRGENSVYDQRTETSGWRENGILNAQHIALTFPEFTTDNFDLAFNAAEANRADELVPSRSGYIKRSVCWGVWSSETPRGDNLAKVLDSIGAWMVQRDGGLTVGIQLIDDVPTASVTIALEDIKSWDWKSGPDGVERPNICRVKYYSPERNYDMVEIDLTGVGWARIDDEVARCGEKFYDVELPFCPHAGQAQRRARQMFGLARADTGIIKTNMAGLAALGEQVINIEFPDDMGTVLCAIEPVRITDNDAPIEIAFRVWPTLTPWDINTDEADAPATIPDVAYGTPLTTPDTPSAATVVTFPDATPQTRVRYTVPGDATVVEPTYRILTNGKPGLWRAMNLWESVNGYTMGYVDSDFTGLDIEFRLRTDDDSGNSSFWSGTLRSVIAVNNTAPSAPTFGPTVNISMGSINVSVFAPESFNIADLVLTGADHPTPTDVKPGQQYSWNTTSFGNFTAIAKSSNGTASSTATLRSAVSAGTHGRIAASYIVGSGQVVIDWLASTDPAVATVEFTGGGAPGPAAVSAGATGQWIHHSPSAGTQTYTIQSYDGSHVAIGSPESVSITV